jgi:SsrA-binding protein
MTVLTENKKAHFNYQILENFEAGLVLTGPEVKSIRAGRIQIAGAFVTFKGTELYLTNAVISPYQPMNMSQDYQEDRPRKLLLKKSEIEYLIGRVAERGLTLIPLRLYTKKRKIKLEFGIAKGKKAADKRESIKKRESARTIKRELGIRG